MTVTASDAIGEIVIREARAADLSTIATIEQQCFRTPWPEDAFAAHLDAVGFSVAVVNGSVVGYIVASLKSGFSGPVGHIKDLAVDPRYRRQGVADQLLTVAREKVHAAGACTVTLEVRESNHAAIALYRSHGFRQTKRRFGYYEDGETALVFVRRT